MDGHGGESEDGLDQKQNKQQEKWKSYVYNAQCHTL
jgi:hypothetical protein